MLYHQRQLPVAQQMVRCHNLDDSLFLSALKLVLCFVAQILRQVYSWFQHQKVFQQLQHHIYQHLLIQVTLQKLKDLQILELLFRVLVLSLIHI